MARRVDLSRDDAEFLTDLLMLSDHYLARELSQNLRERFGMVDEAKERKVMARDGVTLQDVAKRAGIRA